MPRGDKTGPDGEGPKTGRGLGDCEPRNRIPKNQEPHQPTERMPRPRGGRGFFNRLFNRK